MRIAMSVDKSGQRVQRMFGQIADRYDFMNHFLSGGVDYWWRHVTIRKAPPQGKAPILDVCTGTGDLAIAYWKAARGKVEVIGSDFTPEMLKHADVKSAGLSRKENTAPITFQQADTMDLPFEDNKFQLVSVAFGLRNVADTKAGLAEMMRVCQPGGRIVILEFSMPGNPVIRAGYSWYFKNILPRLGQLLARNDQSAYNYLPDSVSEFPHGNAMVSLLGEMGLEQVSCRPLTFGVASLYIGHKPAQVVNTSRETVRAGQGSQSHE